HRAMSIPFANITIFHEGDYVGWLAVKDFELGDTLSAIELYEVFYIVDQQAMERLVSETVARRRIAVEAHATVDMSGFGMLLPTVSVRRKVSFMLPPPPSSANYTLHDVSGPFVDDKNGSVTAHATVKASIPFKGISANIDPLCFDISFCDATIASVFTGPATINLSGDVDIFSAINIKRIASNKHEQALADLVRDVASGRDIRFSISGANPDDNCGSSTAPLWLRRALSKAMVPVSIDFNHLPTEQFPALDGLVKDVVVDHFYANWNTSSGFNPWIAVSGQTTVQLPNPYGANFTFEIESLVPRIQLVDDKKRVFATVDTPSIPLQMLQISPLTYSIKYDFDHIGLNVAERRQKQFTYTMQRALIDRHLLVGINGTLDVVFSSSIGRLRIDALPFYRTVDQTFLHQNNTSAEHITEQIADSTADLESIISKLSVGRMHITDTSESLIAMEVDINIDNPFSYGAYLSDIAMHVSFAGLRFAQIGIRELSIKQGTNRVTIHVDFYNHPKDPRQRMMFLQASSGKPMTIEISGFPNCTSIAPLEASLREFSQKVTIDTAKLKNGHGRLALEQLPK
ncbi:hypothetical protein FB639_004828, partial [Coemansia asiatica]